MHRLSTLLVAVPPHVLNALLAAMPVSTRAARAGYAAAAAHSSTRIVRIRRLVRGCVKALQHVIFVRRVRGCVEAVIKAWVALLSFVDVVHLQIMNAITTRVALAVAFRPSL